MKRSCKIKFLLKIRKIRTLLIKEELLSLFCAALLFPFVTKLVQFYLEKSVLFHELVANSNLVKIFFLGVWIVIFESLLCLFFYKFFKELDTNDLGAAIGQGLKEIKVGIMWVLVILVLDFLAQSFPV